MCVRKLINFRYFCIPITWSYDQWKIFYMHLKLSQWKFFVLKKWLKTWIFESFAESKVICVENKCISCRCTHFLLVISNTDCILWLSKVLRRSMKPYEGILDIYNHCQVHTQPLQTLLSNYFSSKNKQNRYVFIHLL